MSTPSGLLSFDAYANQESAVQLTLTNLGNTDLTNVNLTSSAPTGWTVRFANETIDVIEAGATVETTAYITPGENAMSGDYLTTISAADSNTSDSAEFRVTVKTETTGGIVGIAAIVEAAREVCERAGVSMDEVSCIVPHQANDRIIRFAAKKLGVPYERWQVSIAEAGNTSASSVLMALSDAYDEGRIQPGDKVMCVGFGGGLTSGALLFEA